MAMQRLADGVQMQRIYMLAHSVRFIPLIKIDDVFTPHPLPPPSSPLLSLPRSLPRCLNTCPPCPLLPFLRPPSLIPHFSLLLNSRIVSLYPFSFSSCLPSSLHLSISPSLQFPTVTFLCLPTCLLPSLLTSPVPGNSVKSRTQNGPVMPASAARYRRRSVSFSRPSGTQAQQEASHPTRSPSSQTFATMVLCGGMLRWFNAAA